MIDDKPKRRRATSNISRAREWCRTHGLRAEIVERRLTGIVKVDAFGFADLLVVGGPQAKLVQVCNTSTRREHLRTMAGCTDAIYDCIMSGLWVEMWTWDKRQRNGRAIWTPGPRARVIGVVTATCDIVGSVAGWKPVRRNEPGIVIGWSEETDGRALHDEWIDAPMPKPKKGA